MASHCDPWIKAEAKRIGGQIRPSPSSFLPIWGFFLPFGTQCLHSQWGSNDHFDKALNKASRRGRPSTLLAAHRASSSCSFVWTDLILAHKPLFIQDVVILFCKWGNWVGWLLDLKAQFLAALLKASSRLIALTVHLPTSCSTLWVMKTCCEEKLHPWLYLHSMPCSYKGCITDVPGT